MRILKKITSDARGMIKSRSVGELEISAVAGTGLIGVSKDKDSRSALGVVGESGVN